MLLKVSILFSNISKWFRYKATYYEMKHYTKKIVLKHENVRWMKPIYPYMRNIGKTYTLISLGLKYQIPIAVPYECWISHIKNIEHKYFKSDKLEVIHMSSNTYGRRFEFLLVEEGFKAEVLNNNIYPICKNIIGYVNY